MDVPSRWQVIGFWMASTCTRTSRSGRGASKLATQTSEEEEEGDDGVANRGHRDDEEGDCRQLFRHLHPPRTIGEEAVPLVTII